MAASSSTHLLAAKGGDGRAGRAIGEGAGLVGANVVALNALVCQVIGREDALGAGADGRGAGNGAGLIDQDRVGGHQGAILFSAHLDLDPGPGGGAGGLKGFGAGHLHLDRAARLFGKQSGHRFQVHGYLAAEAAADLHGHHFDLGYRQVQDTGQVVPGHEGPLGTGPHRQVAVGVPKGGGVLRLDVALVDGTGVEFPFDDEIGFLEGFLHVALFVNETVGDVAVLVGGLAELGGGELVVQQGRVVLHGIQHVGGGGQDFIIDLDQGGGFLGDVHRIGGHAGDGMAAEQSLGAGEDVVAGGAGRKRRVVFGGDGQVGACHHGAGRPAARRRRWCRWT